MKLIKEDDVREAMEKVKFDRDAIMEAVDALPEYKTQFGKTLEEMLVELRDWCAKGAAEERMKKTTDFYRCGFYDGGMEILGAIMLQILGGKRMMEEWAKNRGESLLEDVKDYVEENYDGKD